MSLTIVIVTFKSQHLISNLIKSIPEEFNILIVENSKDLELKSFLESSYKNVKVYIPEENLGYARGVNYGVRKASTKYVLCLVADVIFEKQTHPGRKKELMCSLALGALRHASGPSAML